ncbi:IclR family transcriptional regulator [Enteractinococcus coprophilus]|uniref:Glycerol operon regulatory protein n=1 Tax=Enteractinococcus coprophilus TaxID=1027633 RepID=A0A542ZYQ3_9MICC|nr:IclR family transcriptional regulator [Enteractinococcus coprophilus]TQL65449.1 IclR family transcriptional regulator [Enteractinococcus coprophilus]
MPTPDESTTRQPQGAPAALLNGLAILESFSIRRPVLGVTEISEIVGLHKSTVSRMLNGLAELGYVQRERDGGRYRLGLSVLELSAPLLADLDIRDAGLEHLERLTEITGETSALGVWSGTGTIVVDQVASPHQVRHTQPIGNRYNQWSSSSVRVMLAYQPLKTVHELIDDGLIIAPKGGLSRQQIEEDLEEIRRTGVAMNKGHTTPEEFGVSAVVRDLRGAEIGCVVLSAPSSRVELNDSAESLQEAVRRTANDISARLGASVVSENGQGHDSEESRP